MALSRRAFLAGCAGCVAAPAATANARRRQPADLSTSVGFPDPARHWRGESSVAAAIRAGQFFRAPSIPPPISCGEVFDAGRVGALLRARFRDLQRHFIFEYYLRYLPAAQEGGWLPGTGLQDVSDLPPPPRDRLPWRRP